MSRIASADPKRPGGRPEQPPAGAHDPTGSEPTEPEPKTRPADAEQQPSASLEGLPPSANPANWVDHED